MEAETRFCTSADGTQIAYTVYGDKPGRPVIRVSPWIENQELIDAVPQYRRVRDLIAEKRPIVLFDQRGVGGSQRDIKDVSPDPLMADLSAVVDAIGAEQVDLVGWADGCPTAASYAVQNPKRVVHLALVHPLTHGAVSDHAETRSAIFELVKANWPIAIRTIIDIAMPDSQPEHRQVVASTTRRTVSPEIALLYMRYYASYDMRDILPKITVPTAVIGQAGSGRRSALAVSALIPGAVALPVTDLAMDDPDAFVERLYQFLDEEDHPTPNAGAPSGTSIILFLDIADSTALTTKLGDAAYRERERELDGALRSAITQAGGTPMEGNVLGDGVMATFSSARQAIDAAQRCRDLGNEAGLPLHVGIHAGDVVREGNNVHGGAVQVAARVQGASEPGEILVSQTVRDLARTSAGVAFEDRGERELKGIVEPVRLFAVRDAN